jgi:predicted Zn finger-like uncharacterized protein
MITPCKSCHIVLRSDGSLAKATGTRVKCSKCQEVFRAYPREPIDRRKHPRVKTNNLVSYFSFDETGKLISHGLGIALDISKGGILLETPYAIESGLILLGALDWAKNLIEVKGKIVYSEKKSPDIYRSGIEFIGIDERMVEFIINLVKDYNYRGYDLFLAIGRKIQDLQCQTIYG